MAATRVEIDKKQKVAVIVGEGDFARSGAVADLEASFREARQAGITNVVWDASRVGLVTSTTLGTLVRHHKDLIGRGGRLVIVPTPFLRRVLGETQLDQLLFLADDVKAAKAKAAEK
jgi:anti-anti-sigma factor